MATNYNDLLNSLTHTELATILMTMTEFDDVDMPYHDRLHQALLELGHIPVVTD